MRDSSNRYTAPHWHTPGFRYKRLLDHLDPYAWSYSERTPIERLRDDILGRLVSIEKHTRDAAKAMRDASDDAWRAGAFRNFKDYQACRAVLLRQLNEVNAAILEARTRRGIQAAIIEPMRATG